MNLTENGRTAFLEHQKYHEESGSEFAKIMSQMPQEYQDYTIQFLIAFKKIMDEKLEKKERNG